MKIGVCLPGGGVKGAFQAGVLKALYERGLTSYSAYTCTSIGAINGYHIYTGNVDKMEDLWMNGLYINGEPLKSVDNIIDNQERMKMLCDLEFKSEKTDSSFYVNFLQVRGRAGKEVIVDISKLDHEEQIENIVYTCALPFNHKKGLFSLNEVKQLVMDGVYDGKNLDGGMARNTYFDPLLEEGVDKVLIISTRYNFKLPDRVAQKIDTSKIVIISPSTEISNREMLNFSAKLCKSQFDEGYEVGKNFDLALLEKETVLSK